MELSDHDLEFLTNNHQAATILDGPDAPALTLQLMRLMQDKPTGSVSWFGGELDEEQFLQTMVEEGRLIYEFDVRRACGLR